MAPVDQREGGLIDELVEFNYADHRQSQKVTPKVWNFVFNQQPEPPYGRIEMQMCTLLLGLLYVSEPVWVVSRFVVCICLRQSPPLNQMQQPIKQSRQRLNNIADIKLFKTLWRISVAKRFWRIMKPKTVLLSYREQKREQIVYHWGEFLSGYYNLPR